MLNNQVLKTKNARDIITLNYAIVRAYHHNSSGRQRLWAVATDNRNNIIAEAGNYYRTTHPLQFHFAKRCGCDYQNTLHAEIHVIAHLRRMRKKAHKLFISRAGYMQRPLLAKPCSICTEAIKDEEIKNIYWSFNN